MHVHAREINATLQLVNAQDESLGQITIESADHGLVTGVFDPGPLFVSVQRLFQAYEEAVNLQSLKVIDELDIELAKLRLGVILPAGRRINIDNVQIWSDGAISFRPVGSEASLLTAGAET